MAAWCLLPHFGEANGRELEFSRIIVFGDSLSDTGNFYGLFGHPPSPPNLRGRASNGPVWVEHLAALLGLGDRLDNKAIIGAKTGEGNVSAEGPLGFLAQVRRYIDENAIADPNALYVIWIGGNNFDAIDKDPDISLTKAIAIIEGAMLDIRAGVKTLADRGARRFLIPNLPDLGRVPRVLEQADPQKSALASAGATVFNSNLDYLLDGLEDELEIEVHRFDVFGLFADVQSNPEVYGFEVLGERCHQENGSVCQNPDAYVFWDAVHPSAATHALLGTKAYNALLEDCRTSSEGHAAGFSRGDGNQDGTLDISDAIITLTYLFIGGDALCIDALDVDDSGGVDISDPIAALGFLLLGGPAPRGPFPECGPDPTQDLLDCGLPACRIDSCSSPSMPSAAVTITYPEHGSFRSEVEIDLEGQVRVAGIVKSSSFDGLAVSVGDVEVNPGPDGSFEAFVSLDANEEIHSILAEVRWRDRRILARDGIAIIQGAPLANGEMVSRAVVADATKRGLQRIQPEVDFRLLPKLDLWPYVKKINVHEAWGPFSLRCFPTRAGFGCHSIEIVPKGDLLNVQVLVYDIEINYHVIGSMHLPAGIDIDVDCDFRLYAPFFKVEADLSLAPKVSGNPGEVEVMQVGPIRWVLSNLFTDFSGAAICDERLLESLDDLAGLVGSRFLPNVQWEVRKAIQEALNPVPIRSGVASNTPISEALEDTIREIRVSGPVGDALGVALRGDIDEIDLRRGITVAFDALIEAQRPVNPTTTRTLDIPRTTPNLTGISPVDGKPHSLELGIALSLFNQLLKAQTDQGLLAKEIREMDLGSGTPEPLRIGVLARIFPDLRRMDPNTSLVIRLSPTLPPMLVDSPKPVGGLADVVLSHYLVELVAAGTGTKNDLVLLRAAVNARAGVDFTLNTNPASFRVSLVGLGPENTSVTVLSNSLGVPNQAVEALFGFLISKQLGGFERFLQDYPLPELPGIDLRRPTFAKQGGYITMFIDLEPEHGRPDLLISSIELPRSIDHNFPFAVKVTVQNAGTKTARSPVQIGFSLSIDSVMLNGDDIGLAQFPLNLSADPLAPDEEGSYTYWLNAIPWALGLRTLFVCVDLPPPPFGFPTSGNLCEASEINNCNSVKFNPTAPDAGICDIEVPDDLVGEVGPRKYRVCVYRDDVGIDTLLVPVRVVVGIPGHPTTTWGDIIVPVGRGRTEWAEVWVPTPPSFGKPGEKPIFPVLACANLTDDSNSSNNCKSSTARIAVPYWDLRFSITGPRSIHACDPRRVTWTVRVENAGNLPSPYIRGGGRTALSLNRADPNVWCCDIASGSFNVFDIPMLAPKMKGDFQFGFFPNCGMKTGTQYFKAGINRAVGAYDLFLSGNFTSLLVEVAR